MHAFTQAREYCARHMHACIYPSPCVLCTSHSCMHLPKPVHAVHATFMHPFTQARACCVRHMHAPIYPSPCMLCTPHSCTHSPKPMHAVHATCMHSFCVCHVYAPFAEAHACGARLLHEPILLG